MRHATFTGILCTAVLLIGAAPPPGAYVDAQELFTHGAEGQRWPRMTATLTREFDDMCGDSFCEGVYSNIEPISFRCSAARGSGELKRCVWVFGESNEDIDGGTGEIQVDHRSVACDIPVNSTAAALVDALLAPGDTSPLYRKLPGTNATIVDALGRCL